MVKAMLTCGGYGVDARRSPLPEPSMLPPPTRARATFAGRLGADGIHAFNGVFKSFDFDRQGTFVGPAIVHAT